MCGVHHGRVMPTHEASAKGGGEPSPPVATSQRPVRSARARLPVRFNDYEADFSLIAQEYPLAEPQSFEEAVISLDSHEHCNAM